MAEPEEPSDQEIIDKLTRGEIRLHEIDRYRQPPDAVRLRRLFIERETGIKLSNVAEFSFDCEAACKRNIENMVGGVQLPLGIAGPLLVNGEYARGSFYIPLATTEGALVASTNRGCSAITKSGGATACIINDGMTRAPVFKTRGAKEVKELLKWTEENFHRLKERAEATTRFGELLEIKPFVSGRNVYLRFKFDTKDAMGMNMVTIATDAACDLILQENQDVELVSLSGNMCTDKKPSAVNLILGRGKTVIAETTLPRKIVEEKLKTTPERMVEVNRCKNLQGSALAGSLGFNAHAANITAAIFLATGQDPAHLVEASTTLTSLEVTPGGDLYCNVTIPALPVGTVGGGTSLATQEECLEILRVSGPGEPPGNNARKLAEITGAAILAGEISLLAAQAARHLSQAHARLGR